MSEKISFDNEYALQQLTNNYLKIFGLEFVAAEFQCEGQKVDGLAVNITSKAEEKKSFVIIEYKNRKDSDVLDQGERYYKNLQNYKEDYIKRYNEAFKTNLDKNDFDFSKTKVMIIAPDFYKSQIDNKEKFIELWKVSLFDDGKVTYEKMERENEIIELKIDFKKYEECLENKTLKKESEDKKELYYNFRDKILENFKKNLKRVYIKKGISFRVNNKIACIFHFRKNVIIRYYTDELLDCEDKTTYKPKEENKPAYYELTLKSKDDIDYALELFKQVHNQKMGG